MGYQKLIYNFAENHALTILRVGIGLVFLLAGLHRIFFFSIGYQNFLDLGILFATPLLIITILVEIICGFLLIINRFIIPASLAIIALLATGIIVSFVKAGYNFIEDINELFILTATPTNILLHITYLVGILTLLLYSLSKKKEY